MRTVILAAMMVVAVLSPSLVSAAQSDSYCTDGVPRYGSFGRQDTPIWRFKECLRLREEEREREADQKRREEQRARQQEKAAQDARAEAQRRDAAVSNRREDADRQRAADCSTYGTCPSTSRDLQEQLRRQK